MMANLTRWCHGRQGRLCPLLELGDQLGLLLVGGRLPVYELELGGHAELQGAGLGDDCSGHDHLVHERSTPYLLVRRLLRLRRVLALLALLPFSPLLAPFA